jgi:hypothetical protein
MNLYWFLSCRAAHLINESKNIGELYLLMSSAKSLYTTLQVYLKNTESH